MSESEPSNPQPVKPQPGRELKKIREQAGVTVSFIASRTMISESRLHALENDDYENLGSIAYITGYTRAYAKVVGFDPSSHILAFEEAVGFERKAAAAPQLDFKPLPRRPKLRISTVIASAILVMLVGVFGLLYWVRDGGSSVAPAAPPAALAVPEPAAEAAPVLVTRRASDPGEEPAFGATAARFASQPLAQANTDSQPAETAPVVESAIAEAVVVAASPVASSEAATTSELLLKFTEECWLRITDAEGNRLVDTIKTAGDELRVSGVAPFNIKLGNARAVDMLFDGEPVPLVARPGFRTLELSVGD